MSASDSRARSPIVSETACWIWPTSLVIREISFPLVLAEKNAADCPRIWRNRTLRRSRTTRCPTSAIQYEDRYAASPLTRDTTMIAVETRRRFSRLGHTSSKIGLVHAPAAAAAAADHTHAGHAPGHR